MTFWFEEDTNRLIGNHGAEFAEITDDGNLVIEIDDMDRGVGKLEEMKRAIEFAIEANDD